MTDSAINSQANEDPVKSEGYWERVGLPEWSGKGPDQVTLAIWGEYKDRLFNDVEDMSPSNLHKAALEHPDDSFVRNLLYVANSYPTPCQSFLMEQNLNQPAWNAPSSPRDLKKIKTGSEFYKLMAGAVCQRTKKQGQGISLLMEGLLETIKRSCEALYTWQDPDGRRLPLGSDLESMLPKILEEIDEMNLMRFGNFLTQNRLLMPDILANTKRINKDMDIIGPLLGDDLIRFVVANPLLDDNGLDKLVDYYISMCDRALGPVDLGDLQFFRWMEDQGKKLRPEQLDRANQLFKLSPGLGGFLCIPEMARNKEVRQVVFDRDGVGILQKCWALPFLEGAEWLSLAKMALGFYGKSGEEIMEELLDSLEYTKSRQLVGLKRKDLAFLVKHPDQKIRVIGLRLAREIKIENKGSYVR